MGSLSLRRFAVGVGVLVVALFAAGCEGEDPSDPITPTGKPIPPHTSETSDPTAPTSAAPRQPPVATVEAWVAAYNEALRSGDMASLVDTTGPDCQTCDELQSSVSDVYSAGGFFRGGQWIVDAAEVTSRSEERIQVTAGITVRAGTTKSSSDAAPESYSEEKFVIEFEVGRPHQQPVVTQMVFLS